jgi:sugar phosphate isomerase/epimerase
MKSSITISLVEEARGGPFVLWEGLDEGCRQAAEWGFDAVEIFAPSADALDVPALRRKLASHSLQLAALGTGAGWVKHRLTLTDADPERRAAAGAFVRSIIDVAGQCGAPAIIGSMQGRSAPEVDRDTALDYLRQALDQLAPAAARHGVPLILEPLNRYETDLCNTLAEGCALLAQLDTDNVLLLADLFHMNIEEADLGESLEQAGVRVGHVHFVDSNRRAVGLGHLDVSVVIDALREIDYGGYLSAEALPLPDSAVAAEMTIRAFRHWTSIGE